MIPILNTDFSTAKSSTKLLDFVDLNNREKKYFPGTVKEFRIAGEGEYFSASKGLGDYFAKVIVDGEIKLLKSYYYASNGNIQAGRVPTAIYFLYNTKTRIATFCHTIGFDNGEENGAYMTTLFEKEQNKKLSKNQIEFFRHYFYDYPALIEAIQNKNSTYADIPKIVEIFNKWKAQSHESSQ